MYVSSLPSALPVSPRSRGRPCRPSDAFEDWTGPLRRLIQQEPLIQTGPSLSQLPWASTKDKPSCVFVGIGLCTPSALSQALPIDVLGMLLPAEQIRRTLGAERFMVLVADAHAESNRFSAHCIAQRARSTVEQLERMGGRLGFRNMTVLRASEFHGTAAYRRRLGRVRRQSTYDLPDYVCRQMADVAHLSERYGRLVKVGWSMGQDGHGDERTLDALVKPLIGTDAVYVYCRPGMALDDTRPRAVPYVATDADKRICLDLDEDVARKLRLAEETVRGTTVRAVRNHLKTITSSYARTVDPLRGPVTRRTQAVIEMLCG